MENYKNNISHISVSSTMLERFKLCKPQIIDKGARWEFLFYTFTSGLTDRLSQIEEQLQKMIDDLHYGLYLQSRFAIWFISWPPVLSHHQQKQGSKKQGDNYKMQTNQLTVVKTHGIKVSTENAKLSNFKSGGDNYKYSQAKHKKQRLAKQKYIHTRVHRLGTVYHIATGCCIAI